MEIVFGAITVQMSLLHQGQTKVDYLLDPNVYGKFEDPYLKDKVNPHATDFTVNGEQVKFL